MNWDRIITQRQASYPAENFIRFVARNYYDADRHSVHFLDIGCGAGANSWYLAREGFRVTALDGSEAALGSLRHRFEKERWPDNIALVHAEIGSWYYPTDTFDCVLDHNALCHVEEPPMALIRASLVDGGKLFAVMPADDTWKGTLEGKGFCRTPNEQQARELFADFSETKIHKASYPDGEHLITSFIIEAVK